MKKQDKNIKVETSDPIDSFLGLPIKITPEIREVTFDLKQTNLEKYQAIKRSIELANGKLDEPIKLTKLGSETGDYYTIVDGHTRFQILHEIEGNLRTSDENFLVLKDVEDPKKLAYRLNGLRRQQEHYQQAVSAIRAANPVSTDRELADLSGVGSTTINHVRFILAQKSAEINSEVEKGEYAKILSNLESGTTKIDAAYKQLNMAIEVNTVIALIEDLKFKIEMQTKYERLKFTDKNALKKLQSEIDAHDAEAEGQDLSVNPYYKAIRPLMDKAIKLQEIYSGVQSFTSAGHKDALENMKNSLRTFLMNNINENIVDILEGSRSAIIEELEKKQTKDISAIMEQVDKLLSVSKHDYFLSVINLNKDQQPAKQQPEQRPVEKKPKQKSVA